MRRSLISALLFLLFEGVAYSQTADDYLILQDIGRYKSTIGREFVLMGKVYKGGPLVSRLGDEVSGYYMAYETDYEGGEGYSAPTVQVRLHTSTQWLGHEVEGGYRTEKTMDATFSAPNPVREIDGQRIFQLKRRAYSWVSGGNKVINITYTDLTGTKPEPIEIIQAYLAKYPSSITLTNEEAKSPSHTESWLRNEMERRVWLMEKWAGVGNADVLKQAEAMRTILTHVEVFAKYRQKYLGEDPLPLIRAFFQAAGSGGVVTPDGWARLVEEVAKLRTWWDQNKGRPLSL
jgi:hypothetical protein